MSTMTNFSVTGVLLAGGKSTRMGFDKALLEIDGIPLWRRQLDLLESLQLEQYLISGKLDGLYHESGISVVTDCTPDSGPLGGIVSCLQQATTDAIFVIAVDTPNLTASLLHTMLDRAKGIRKGIVPVIGGRFEPLVAIYPVNVVSLAERNLRAGILSLQPLISELIESHRVKTFAISHAEEMLFRNLNHPEDLIPGSSWSEIRVPPSVARTSAS